MKRILFVIVALFLVAALAVSVTLNVSTMRKIDRHEQAIRVVLAETAIGYSIDALHHAIHQQLAEGELVLDDHAVHFQRLSRLQQRLAGIYNSLHDADPDGIRVTLSENSPFHLFVDGETFFRALEASNREAVREEEGRSVLPLDAVNPDVREGLAILADVTGELAAIWQQSCEGRDSGSQEAMRRYMVDSAEYYSREQTRQKVRAFQVVLHGLLAES